MDTKISTSEKTPLGKKFEILKNKKESLQKDLIDEKKLTNLQKLIDRGEYRVDSNKLADKVVEKHLGHGRLKK